MATKQKNLYATLCVIILCLSLTSIFAQIPGAKADSTNLEPITAFFPDMNGAASSYASLDYSTMHIGDGPSIRVGPDYVRGTREVDGAWLSVNPGDHIVMSVWVKTATYLSTDPQAGASFGFDFYASTSIGYAIVDISNDGSQAGHPTGAELNYAGGVNAYGHTINGESGLTQVGGLVCRVPFNKDWTLIQWDFTVPTTYYTWATTGANFPGGQAVNPVQINSLVPWFTGRNIFDNAYMWFSDPNVQINPSGPTPPPSGSVTDTIGSTSNHGNGNNGYLAGSAITASQTGTLSTIGLNIATSSGNLRAAIYTTYSGGVFSGLVGQTASVATQVGWNDLSISGSVTAGNNYYLVWIGDTYIDRYWSSTGTAYLAPMTYGAFSDPTNSLTPITGTENMRITYNPSGSPTPTPSPTPTLPPGTTPTPTPTPTVAPTSPPRPGEGNQFIITRDPFIVNYSTGGSFAVQSLNPASTITFTITSGTLNGTGSVNASNIGGVFQIVPTTSGTLLVTSTGAPVSIYIDGVYHNNIPFEFTPGDPLITWTYGSTVIVNNNGVQYYFRSDTYNTLSESGYGFDSDYTNTAQSINEIYSGTGDVTYGFQVYLFSSPTQYTELTSGISATMLVSGNYYSSASAIINIPQTPVILGSQALRIKVLEQFNGGSWITVANFISPVLITNSIEASTWQFVLQVNQTQVGGNTYSNFLFGNNAYKSGVNNILFSKPLQSDVAMWRLSRGDYIGFLLGEYLDEIGIGFYGLCLFLVGSTLYYRYKSFGTILFFFSIYGGVGGLAWIFLPPWGAAVAAAIIIIGGSFLVWKIVR